MNLVYQLYYELQIIFELLFLTISKYFSNNDSFIFCVINSLYYIFDYNFFRVVDSSVGKYISVENVEEKKYNLALNFGSYDYIGFSNKISSGKDTTPKINTNVKAFFEKLGGGKQSREILKMLDISIYYKKFFK